MMLLHKQSVITTLHEGTIVAILHHLNLAPGFLLKDTSGLGVEAATVVSLSYSCLHLVLTRQEIALKHSSGTA